jgi:hypothetical protein
MSDEPVAVPAPITYKEDDLVYVDPELKVVIGLVEWLPSGKPKALAIKDTKPEAADDEDDGKAKGRVRPRRIRYYPWGTYRSMKRVYKLEGKPPRVESSKTLDDVIEKALQEPFWD